MNTAHVACPARPARFGRVPRTRRVLLQALALWPLVAATGLSAAPALPYDEQADAPAQLQQAQEAARAARKPLLVVLGANWCEDCRALDAAMKSSANAPLLAQRFVLLKIDVGNFDRNLALVRRWGNPIAKGIPAAVLLSPEGELRYATRAGELSSARRMSETGVRDFFAQIADNPTVR